MNTLSRAKHPWLGLALISGTAATAVGLFVTWQPCRSVFLLFIDHLQQHDGAYSFLGTMILTALTLRYVVLTSRLVGETQAMRHAAVEPAVVISAINSTDGSYGVSLQLANVGSGPAYNIRLRCEPEIAFFDGFDRLAGEAKIGRSISSITEFEHGIACLPSHGYREVNLAYRTVGWTNHKGAFTITAAFRDSLGREHSITQTLDFDNLQGIGPKDMGSLEEIARSLKEIAFGINELRSR